jgi:hypothetical protein
MVAALKSEWVAAFKSECPAGFIGIRTFTTKGLDYLKESVIALLNGSNLANDRIRKLYVALSGDEVHKTAFWS